MKRFIVAVSFALMCVKTAHPCDPVETDHLGSGILFASASDLTPVVGQHPAFVWRSDISPAPETLRLWRYVGESNPEPVEIAVTVVPGHPELERNQVVLRPAEPLEGGTYSAGAGLFRVVPGLAEAFPSLGNFQTARIIRFRPTGCWVEDCSGCERDECIPPDEVAQLVIDLDGRTQDPLAQWANFLVSQRNEATGATERFLLGSYSDRLTSTQTSEAVALMHDKICITIAAVGWEGTPGPELDLGCHRSESM